MKMKILFVHNMLPEDQSPSGIFVYEQARNLNAQAENIEVTLFALRRNKFSILNYLNFIPLLREIKKNSIDVVHAHYGLCLITVYLASIFFRGKIKYAATYHGSDLFRGGVVGLISNLFCYLLKAIPIIVSDRMKPLLWPANSIRAKTIPCAVNLPSNEMKESFKFLTALFPGDPARDVKNFDGYLRLVRQLNGRGVYLKTIILASVKKEMVKHILNEVDMVILVSKWEGSPQIVKEALNQLVPVFSLDVGDLDSVIGNIKGCYIEKNISELAIKVEMFGGTARLNQAECQSVLKSFSPEIISKKLARLYSSI